VFVDQEQLRWGVPFLSEMPILTTSGDTRWMEFTVDPARNDAGAIDAWVGAVRDIQARHDVEEDFRASRDLLAAVIGATDEAVCARGSELEGAAASTAAVEPGASTYVAVSDTGAGITPRPLDRIFEPWGEDTGLGLATAYGFARVNDGRMTVETEVDMGTTFHL